jgi:hypothetical protein
MLTKNFKFQDGVYLDFEDFQNNKISLSWDSVYAKLYTNPQKMITLVDSLKHDGEVLNQAVWGFSLGGIPYVNLKRKNEAGLDVFVGLKVRGNICYYRVEEVKEKVETIKAYNPMTGVPFLQDEVVTKVEVENSFMLSFESGKIAALTKENFLEWIENDSKLTQTVKRIEGNVKEKLFKCLLIYDDRNPVFVPLREL